jgi:cold-inducible RNA-binding protein
MSKNLYVGNLAFTTTADDLKEIFAQFGEVSRAQIISDRDTGRSRGFGFVDMSNGGEQAIEKMNGAEFQGRQLTVNESKPRDGHSMSVRPSRPRSETLRRERF